MRLVRLLRPHGSLFTGEKGGWPDDEAARLVADKIGIYADGKSTDEPEQKEPQKEAWVFNPKTDPFITDGISKQASQALHSIELHSVDDVRQFIVSTPEGESPVDRVNAIDGVSEQQAEKIVKLYGTITEHSEE